ncbi:MAG: alanine--tRNA ligase [Planctomycetota bacterium]
MKTVDQIREGFLRFFEGKGHVRLPSDNLVPQNDPTLLFTGAGMNQFKAQFGGVGITHRRVTTCQKCLRTGDIERVGQTPRHHTFFEMLGIFSFGDYFKREAIPWVWEFLTQEVRLPKDRLWITVYKKDPNKDSKEDDTEARDIWSHIVPRERIVGLGEADNFWPASAPSQGPNGPCGPCTEIHFDRCEGARVYGCKKEGRECKPGCSCDRYMEVCNIVFTQFNRQEGGALVPLPQKNIDFGMGLERLAAVVQGCESNFEIDSLKELVHAVATVVGTDQSHEKLPKLRRIADHMRSVVLCIAEGVTPGPNAQGYVVRRLLRRALLDAHEMGASQALLFKLVEVVVNVMRGGYPELSNETDRIRSAVRSEEDSFLRTLKSGSALFNRYRQELEQAGIKVLDGAKAFDLYSTYGFPIELTRDLLAESGMSVDERGYEQAAEKARKISSADTGMESAVFVESPAHKARKLGTTDTRFTGYGSLNEKATVKALFNAKGESMQRLGAGDQGLLVTDLTPFYAEGGGQLGDSGKALWQEGQARIADSQKEAGIFIHVVTVEKGELRTGQAVELSVDESARRATEAHHSATHLLHWALKEVLGPKVGQAGSQVGPETLRFDFSHSSALSADELRRIEDLVNAEIWKSAVTDCREMDLDAAKQSGAVAMFGEKYTGKVRVLSIGPSKELCGGTHVRGTGEIGFLRILSQEAVGSGVRRITAVARGAALNLTRHHERILQESSAILKAPPGELARRVEALQEDFSKARKQLLALQSQLSASSSKDLESKARTCGPLKVLGEQLSEGADLMAVNDSLKGKVDVLFLAAPDKGKVQFLTSCSDAAQKAGFKADVLLKAVSAPLGGRGGGRPQLARGSGDSPSGFAKALESFSALVVTP